MAEYIDREELYEKAYWHGEHPDVGNPFPDGVDAIDIKDVDAIPAADVAPVRQGRWLNIEEHTVLSYNTYFPMTTTSETCSECNVRSAFLGKKRYVKDIRCPNCVARMDGDADD